MQNTHLEKVYCFLPKKKFEMLKIVLLQSSAIIIRHQMISQIQTKQHTYVKTFVSVCNIQYACSVNIFRMKNVRGKIFNSLNIVFYSQVSSHKYHFLYLSNNEDHSSHLQANNPLYKGATSTFQNVAYGGNKE